MTGKTLNLVVKMRFYIFWCCVGCTVIILFLDFGIGTWLHCSVSKITVKSFLKKILINLYSIIQKY